MITLTPEERSRFATYLEQQAHSDTELVAQMADAAAPAALVTRYKALAAAKLAVAHDLRNVDVQEFRG